ncbi:MAG: metallophosphoesterase [Actinobacteria bacterium]|nr:metallophosphoesterase [Actinomycetota bacterium]
MPSRSGPIVRAIGGTLAAGAVVGGAVLAYSLVEARSYRLRHVVAPVLAPGANELLVLHLSDLHLTPGQTDKIAWVNALADLSPDFVVGTGDFLAHPDSVPALAAALGPLLQVPGAFVLGSNDYFSPGLANPLGYLRGPSDRAHGEPDLPWRDLVSVLSAGGWADLTNRHDMMTVNGDLIDMRGVDDPHIERDDYPAVAGPFDPTAALRLGVAHAPYLRVIDAMAADGADLILAGHTHGGQVCIPGYGALVTNCDLDTGRVKGLSQHQSSLMHVSAGLGTSPFAPVRLACPPEATLLQLVPRA